MAFPPRCEFEPRGDSTSEQVDHEFSRSDEEDQDEDQSDGARSESAEAPPRPEVRPDEHNREEERNEDEVGGPREPAGPDREVYDIRREAHGRRRDDQEGRSPDRLPGPAAKAVHYEGDIQQTSADPHAPREEPRAHGRG